MLKRLPLIAGICAVLLLTACGPVTPPTPTDSSSGSGSSGASTPTPSPSDSTGPASAITAGDCTLAESTVVPIPVIYTVYTADSTTPVTIRYMAFNHDGSLPIQTLTTVGPVINIIGYTCTTAAGEATWTLTASSNLRGTASIGCVLDFGGQLVKTDSNGAESATASTINVNCSGNPGK